MPHIVIQRPCLTVDVLPLMVGFKTVPVIAFPYTKEGTSELGQSEIKHLALAHILFIRASNVAIISFRESTITALDGTLGLGRSQQQLLLWKRGRIHFSGYLPIFLILFKQRLL